MILILTSNKEETIFLAILTLKLMFYKKIKLNYYVVKKLLILFSGF